MKIKYRSIGLAVLMGIVIGSMSISQAIAFPYQDMSRESYAIEREKLYAVIKREPKNATAYLELGKFLEAEATAGYWTDCYVQSIQVYRQAIVVAGASAEIYFRLGQALMTDSDNSTTCAAEYLDAAQIKDRKKEGLSHFLNATLLDRSNDEYLIALGDAFKEKGELDAAIVAYKAAIYLEINPNQKSDSLYHRSAQYSSIGDGLFKTAYFKEAEAAYRKALAIEPEDSYVQGRLKAVKIKLIR
jgi:tetratricopeptide (TPR) repeat protein